MQLYLHASRSTLVVREFLIALVISCFIDFIKCITDQGHLVLYFS